MMKIEFKKKSLCPMPSTKDVSELKKRSYLFIDRIAETILSDPDFKREFFTDKGKIN